MKYSHPDAFWGLAVVSAYKVTLKTPRFSACQTGGCILPIGSLGQTFSSSIPSFKIRQSQNCSPKSTLFHKPLQCFISLPGGVTHRWYKLSGSSRQLGRRLGLVARSSGLRVAHLFEWLRYGTRSRRFLWVSQTVFRDPTWYRKRTLLCWFYRLSTEYASLGTRILMRSTESWTWS